MPDEGAGRRTRRRPRIAWRAWLRALHRDAGYLAVGLTVVYALSGLAINHIDDWNPNFREYETEHQVSLAIEPAADLSGDAVAAAVLDQLGIADAPRDVYRASPTQVDIEFDNRTLHVDTGSGTVHEQGRRPRFFLRVANWLHYNRGKAAWTYIADAYAVFLLFLAGSGLFMLRGRKGIWGRGGIFVLAGIAVPIAYVQLSSGP